MAEVASWFDAPDGFRLRQRRWSPEQPPRATIALLHGGTEHSGRYQHTAQRFIAEGFVVEALDQRSHGESQRVRGVALQIDRFEDLLPRLRPDGD